MQQITTIDEFRRRRADLPGTVAFVPTMGFLHQGHLALMQRGLQLCDHLVVSVFVNPTQFGPGEDLDAYPRDLEGDSKKCRDQGCDLLFTPDRSEIYADDDSTRVTVDGLAGVLCGKSRPGHFKGVATVVTRFFNIVDPDVAIFGQKDYQQLAIIERMTRDLHFPVEIVGVPTVREKDGLAMSSRNRYLTDSQRRQATSLSCALLAAHKAYNADPDLPCGQLLETTRRHIEEQPDASIDYVECVHPQTLAPYDADESITDGGAVIAVAAIFGSARLIDNLRIDQPIPDGPLRSVACTL